MSLPQGRTNVRASTCGASAFSLSFGSDVKRPHQKYCTLLQYLRFVPLYPGRTTLPVELPGLGRRLLGRPARGLRTRPGARKSRPGGSRLQAHRPVRPAPRPDGRLGGVRRLTGSAAIRFAPPEPGQRPPGPPGLRLARTLDAGRAATRWNRGAGGSAMFGDIAQLHRGLPTISPQPTRSLPSGERSSRRDRRGPTADRWVVIQVVQGFGDGAAAAFACHCGRCRRRRPGLYRLRRPSPLWGLVPGG